MRIERSECAYASTMELTMDNPAPPSNADSGIPATPASGPPFRIGVADKQGKEIPPDEFNFSDPSAAEARVLFFDVHTEAKPTAADMKFARDLAKIGHTLDELYPESDSASQVKFRSYFVRLFNIAQLILEGDTDTNAEHKKKLLSRLAPELAVSEHVL